MRAVVQRVAHARVTVSGEVVGAIEGGLCVFVGVARGDDDTAARALADKVVGLRVFEDAGGKMNLSVAEAGGALLAVSQFTLLGDVRKGRRPSFTAAMEPSGAERLFEAFCRGVRDQGVRVETGRFRTHMDVELLNDGPVTLLIDTERAF